MGFVMPISGGFARNLKRKVRRVILSRAVLAFLHHGRQPPVLHHHIKSATSCSKKGLRPSMLTLASLGSSEQALPRSHVSTQVARTGRYVAPEIWAGLGATAERMYTYSFGVV
ncbi:unnamed protein product [Urochloa humidicola]